MKLNPARSISGDYEAYYICVYGFPDEAHIYAKAEFRTGIVKKYPKLVRDRLHSALDSIIDEMYGVKKNGRDRIRTKNAATTDPRLGNKTAPGHKTKT
jgi:hypothetical protein